MRSFWNWIKRVVVFVVQNGDAFIAIFVAVAVIVAEALGKPSREAVDSAILALLGALAVAILRDRGKSGGLDALRQLAEDAVCERPYVVVWQANHWDLIDRDSALITCTEQLRITREEVSENFLWSIGPGVVRDVAAKWRRSRRDAWVEGKKIYEIPVRGGTKEIFSFNDEHGRGDMLEWCVVRDIQGQFPGANEGVAVEAATKSEHPRALKITWPKDITPKRIEIREGNRPARSLTPRTKDGRFFVEEKVSGLRVGEIVEIDWSW